MGRTRRANFRHGLSERWVLSWHWYDRNGRGDVAMSQLAKQILGSWRMTSWTYATLETGETKDALGPKPRGYINYAPDGRVMVLVLKQDRKTPAALVPTAEEKIALYDTMFAYAGTYSVEADRVIHNVDMSWNKAW